MGTHADTATSVHSCLCFVDMQIPTPSQHEEEGFEGGVGSSAEFYAL